jgi:hypothetical protein
MINLYRRKHVSLYVKSLVIRQQSNLKKKGVEEEEDEVEACRGI